MATRTADDLIEEVRRYGKLTVRAGAVVVSGRFPRALLDELRDRRDEVRRALALPRPSALLDALGDTPGMPRLTLTLIETEDVGGDVALLRRLVALFEAHPGGNRAVVTIRQIDGTRKRAQWRVHATAALRRAVAELLREYAEALALLVNKRTGRCRRCDGQELAYDVPSMRLFCVACRLAAWRTRA